MKMIHDPERVEIEPDRIQCPICHKTFTRSSYVKKHLESVHKTFENEPIVSNLISKITELQSELKERDEQLKSKMEANNEQLKSKLEANNEQLKSELKEQISHELKNKQPSQINQILNVICVTNHDNYLEMLTNQMGNFDQAIEYIKDCALSDLVGDCKLIEKIYTNQNHELSFSINQKNSDVTYQNEQQQLVTENKDTFGRKLANNLQNSYLKGINYLINWTLDHKIDPNKFLADYDVMMWNRHIYQLSDYQHQRKMINQLKISSHELRLDIGRC
jgi:hypothetical protein